MIHTVTPSFYIPIVHISTEYKLHMGMNQYPIMQYWLNQSIEGKSSCPFAPTSCIESSVALMEQVSQIGTIIKINVQWTASEVRRSGWKQQWYKAEVQGYCNETDIVTLCYISELNESYKEELSSLLQRKMNDKTFAISNLTTHIHICIIK